MRLYGQRSGRVALVLEFCRGAVCVFVVWWEKSSYGISKGLL